MRIEDLAHPARFKAKLEILLALHNEALAGHLKAKAMPLQPMLDNALALGEKLAPMFSDVGYALHQRHLAGDNLLFEARTADAHLAGVVEELVEQFGIDARELDINQPVDRDQIFTTPAIEDFLDFDNKNKTVVAAPKGYGKTLLIKSKRHSYEDRAHLLIPQNIVGEARSPHHRDKATGKCH
ncbi:MAG: hypothetical protein HC771_25120 [Synechococcales cyanobacterium CRU_2_2]|nr:hypothetical protein [Synechococcales cyanobacterium CRU_2_2]